MRLILILAISTTTMIFSGCCTVPKPMGHPDLTFPVVSKLPTFTREMLDCRKDNPETLPLCKILKEREVILRDDIDTRDALLEAHNEALKK